MLFLVFTNKPQILIDDKSRCKTPQLAREPVASKMDARPCLRHSVCMQLKQKIDNDVTIPGSPIK